MILLSFLFVYIFNEGLTVFFPCFFNTYSKWSWISGKEYDPSGNSTSSFSVGANIFGAKSILSVRFSNILWA